MVLKVELCSFFNHVVVGVEGIHDQAIGFVGDVLSILLPIFVILVTRSEPVRVVRGVSVASIVIIFTLTSWFSVFSGHLCNLLVIGGQGEAS